MEMSFWLLNCCQSSSLNETRLVSALLGSGKIKNNMKYVEQTTQTSWDWIPLVLLLLRECEYVESRAERA